MIEDKKNDFHLKVSIGLIMVEGKRQGSRGDKVALILSWQITAYKSLTCVSLNTILVVICSRQSLRYKS